MRALSIILSFLVCGILSAANLTIGTNTYSPVGGNYTYTASSSGTLTITFPADVLSRYNTSLGYGFSNGEDVNLWGYFFSDAAVRTFEVLRGETYTLSLYGSMDIMETCSFTAAFVASGNDSGSTTVEKAVITLDNAVWSFLGSRMLQLRVDDTRCTIQMWMPYEGEGAIRFDDIRANTPILTDRSSGAIEYALISGENLCLSRVGDQLLLTGMVVGKFGSRRTEFTLDIRGTYPETWKKENDTPSAALTATEFTDANVSYDSEQGGYIIYALGKGWKSEAQLVIRQDYMGQFPASGSYAVSDEAEATGDCLGGTATGVEHDGVRSVECAGSFAFTLDNGDRILPGWLLTTGTVTIAVQDGVLTATTVAQNSYGVDIRIVMTTAQAVPTALDSTTTEDIVRKHLHDGMLLIECGDVVYDVQGAVVK